MPLVVGVAFKPVTKVYYFDPGDLDDLKPGENVVVDTARGRTLGVVVNAVREVVSDEISGTLKPVLRRASTLDMVQQDQQIHREPEALAVCRARAAALGLPMKMVKAEFNFDGTSLLVYFAAEQRVDFRNLVHDLAQALRTHVEMRQIGVRDEAKFLNGYGRCGRELCCSSWLRDFTPVSIKMAKQQDLPLNPVEISGVCGRLLCCLSYENDFYTESRRQLPKLNSTMMTPEGSGKVRQVHVLRNSVTVLVQGPNDTKLMVEVPIQDSEENAESGCEGCPKAASGPAGRQPVALASEVEVEEELTDEADELGTPELRALEEVPDEESRRPRSGGASAPHHAERQRPRKRGH